MSEEASMGGASPLSVAAPTDKGVSATLVGRASRMRESSANTKACLAARNETRRFCCGRVRSFSCVPVSPQARTGLGIQNRAYHGVLRLLRDRLRSTFVHSPRSCILLSITSPLTGRGGPSRASKELFAPEINQVLLLVGSCMLRLCLRGPGELSERCRVEWDGGRVKGRIGALCRFVETSYGPFQRSHARLIARCMRQARGKPAAV